MSRINSVRIDATPSLLPNSESSGATGLRRVHIRLLRQAKQLGDYLIVALSTDEFNALKGKKSFYPYEVRKEMLEAIRYVDLVIPECSWEQKPTDVKTYDVDVVCMGGDWKNDPRFEALRPICDVVYLERTRGISTTDDKSRLGHLD